MKSDLSASRRAFIRNIGAGTALSVLSPAAYTAFGMPAGRTYPCGKNQEADDLEKLKMLLQSRQPGSWIFTGDSITQGAKHTHGYRSYPEIFGERLRWELKRVRDIVINAGISGHTIRHILDDFEWRISRFAPAVVSVMTGTNDCAKNQIPVDVFKINLESIVSEIRNLNAIPVLHTPNIVIFDKAPERASLPEYAAAIRYVAAEQSVILVDHYLYWENKISSSSDTVVYKNWLNDPLHPNQTGHMEMARLMFKTLKIFDPKEATCGGDYYEGAH